jgi:hypothetical protein
VELSADITAPPPIADPPEIRFGDAKETHVDLPGRPAQVLSLPGKILVTIRDPGLLVILEPGSMKELGRVSVAADAWGVAVSPDAQAAFVTSAWTHTLTKIDLSAKKVLWSVETAREPRGVIVTQDGKSVYVNHLVGADLTKVDATANDAPNPQRIVLPPDPLNTFTGDKSVSASQGYALLLSPDGSRLYASRHALGALWGWNGNPTIDGLSVADDQPLAPARGGKPLGTLTVEELTMPSSWADRSGSIAGIATMSSQPRAMVYRKKTHHILSVSESMVVIDELDALSISPGTISNRRYRLGGLAPKEPTKIQIPPHCGAPSGIALSDDEDVAWVYCRTTDNVVAVRLTPDGDRSLNSETSFLARGAYHSKLSPWGPFAYVKLPAPAPPSEDYALGRRLYYDGTEPVMSGRQSCAGCHPDGRDDGHVWREHKPRWPDQNIFAAGPSITREVGSEEKPKYGVPRQTPMIAGRVKALGPYGWRSESATLVDRLKAGFGLHMGNVVTDGATLRFRAEPISIFLRDGLVPPPHPERELTAQEAQGKAIFENPKTQCATCHAPKSEFTDRSTMPLRGFKTLPLFDEEKAPLGYKVPSLLFVGGTAPYYHDGSAPSLEELIEKNQDRMGHTMQLTADERAALVAYLKTL